MSRYCGPRLRIVRRLGNLPGLTKKKSKKKNLPGQHKKIKQKLTEYSIRLKEKQKLKFNYGLTETQLYKYFLEAKRKHGITGIILLQLLEMRLDSICFGLGFTNTIIAARQIITHGHIMVNNKKINIPSFQCFPKDTIRYFKKIKNIDNFKQIPSHLSYNKINNEGQIKNYPSRSSIQIQLNELLVVEYYSRH
jgi:small subunit ribosomal protein S4